ncbi:MAG: response regulator, partial [Eubacterium sp.]|nr:response regulator [Eubacterium sp.]
YAHVEESVYLMPANVAVLVIICGLGFSRYAYKNLTKPIVQTRDSLRRFVSGDMKETFAMDEVDYVELQQISGLLGQVQEMVENQQLQLKKHQDLVHIEAERADISAAAKRVFLTRISHDVRAPINGIIAMVALAEENIQDTVCVRDSLHRIENSGKQLLMMLNEVLDMSQIESGRADLKEEDFQLAEMIHDTIAALRPAAEARQHQLLLQVKNLTHEYVVGPKDRVKDIIDSIVENSIKYTPRGGVIRVTLTELDSEIRYAGVYQMTFEDNGIGISEEAVAHIFEPFGRAEDDQRAGGIQGAGLGLAIVKNIVQLMNGTIDVESEPESGSKFTVTIKLKLQKRAEGVATRVPKRSLAAVDEFFADRYKDKRVLVVEDNALNADVAAAALTQIGMEVETAVDGQQAVTRMQEVPENYFDLIFMDVQMPVMDGYIATQMIRNLRREDVKRMPIIGMTSLTQEASLDVALQAGMDEYVVKPLEPMRMKGLLQRWL